MSGARKGNEQSVPCEAPNGLARERLQPQGLTRLRRHPLDGRRAAALAQERERERRFAALDGVAW